MTPHVTRDGIPVCREANACGVAPSDQFFASVSFVVSESGTAQLRAFFRDNIARAYAVSGHTDSEGSDAYNLTSSRNRANAVAEIAQSVGALIASVRGCGERRPAMFSTT